MPPARNDLPPSARFKNLVVGGYAFTCALTGHRLVTTQNLVLVEAAHLHAFRDSRNDDPANGLALSPTAHALFDRGLWSVDDHLRVLVRPTTGFTESGPPRLLPTPRPRRPPPALRHLNPPTPRPIPPPLAPRTRFWIRVSAEIRASRISATKADFGIYAQRPMALTVAPEPDA